MNAMALLTWSTYHAKDLCSLLEREHLQTALIFLEKSQTSAEARSNVAAFFVQVCTHKPEMLDLANENMIFHFFLLTFHTKPKIAQKYQSAIDFLEKEKPELLLKGLVSLSETKQAKAKNWHKTEALKFAEEIANKHPELKPSNGCKIEPKYPG